ncbi:MAG: hypothetical protein H5U24_09225 [Thioclava marina]|jgi:hypothetical protein|uniref:hypothetical protein n=1 Tax=Thioclava TaxID=285107 RepID=UPI000995F139|nr:MULTISPECIES: hypothetical protein [Thioclava]MBC7145571.1 hypothetical protein [Thioclava marina]MBD3802945.1 hypothetical protein [Thioclava sp.]OOY27752.1 hypothetical protein BMI90_11120 [Thioclava sp. L04-15]TNE82899.1 MAG: hypothetical protein EP337_18025 [Paracoccaceae bacterium]
MDHWTSDDLAIYNERQKVMATSVNAIGLALVGFAILKPVVEQNRHDPVQLMVWGIIGLALHGISHYILGNLKKEV